MTGRKNPRRQTSGEVFLRRFLKRRSTNDGDVMVLVIVIMMLVMVVVTVQCSDSDGDDDVGVFHFVWSED